jgi:GntR family transcriptional regulator
MTTPSKRSTPLYQELRARLSEELSSGIYPVGSRFPTEQELCARFGLGRHTVREALRGLEEAGLLSRQAGVGTLVLAHSAPQTYSHRLDSLGELWDYALSTKLEKQQEGMVVLRDRLARTLGRDPGERWLRMAGFRTAPQRSHPICWSEIFVAEPYVRIRDLLRRRDMPIYAALFEQFNLRPEVVERSVIAIEMPEEIASVLGVSAGEPALMERRTYLSDKSEVFEITLSIYPGNRFVHTSKLVRERSASTRSA